MKGNQVIDVMRCIVLWDKILFLGVLGDYRQLTMMGLHAKQGWLTKCLLHILS